MSEKRDIATRMAGNQKQASISEFFEKNKHFLGFDSLHRSLITAVKEAVDNALDACEEARILPDITISIRKADPKRDVIELEVEDNGPGIPRDSIAKVFGQLLFGSRFHAIRQSRGQQGIGITGVVMYSQLTTGKPTHVRSKIASETTAVEMELGLDTKSNKAIKSKEQRVPWVLEDGTEKVSGLNVRCRMKAKFQRGKQSVWQYLRMTSIVNPHASITFVDPDGETTHWPRVTERLPRKVSAIKPHPHGIELGQLNRLAKATKAANLSIFLKTDFSGVPGRAVKEMCEVSGLIDAKGQPLKSRPGRLDPEQIRALAETFQGIRGYLRPYRLDHRGSRIYVADARRPGVPSAPIADAKHGDLMDALTEATIDDLLEIVTSRTDMHWEESLVELRSTVQSTHGDGPWNKQTADAISKHLRKTWDPRIVFEPVKLLKPPIDCLSPIEELLIKKGLSKTIDSRFVTTLTRAPAVSSGNPFQIEVGLIFGEGMPADSAVEVLRFANRVPLMYQQGGCMLTKAIESVDWRQYGLDQPGGNGVPKGPAAVLVHLASTNVQFTSEAKEAVADNEEVREEARKAMLELGRGLRKHLEKKKKLAKTQEKFELITDILPAIAEKSASILGREVPTLAGSITKIMNAVIAQEATAWDKESKRTNVEISLSNYTAKARSYTLLANWPQREGATMVDNDRGGRSEMTGVWAWKLETLKPGESATITFALDGLEKGDWTETEVFYRGAGDVIGATKMDDALLKELRRQEEVLTEGEDGGQDDEAPQEDVTASAVEEAEPDSAPAEVSAEAVAPSGNILDWTEGDA